MIIRQIHITPVAFRDPPLLNAAGVHEPWALRTIVEVVTDEGLSGLGETYGDLGHLTKVRECAEALVGVDVHATNEMYARISAIVGDVVTDMHGLTGAATQEKSIDRVFAAFEVACLDIRGKAAGVPVRRPARRRGTRRRAVQRLSLLQVGGASRAASPTGSGRGARPGGAGRRRRRC